MTRCACGCGSRAVHGHEVVYKQEVRRSHGDLKDRRNFMPLALGCHAAHHNRTRPLPVAVLPTAALEFAVDLLGAGAAYEYISRRYGGGDPRLDALLEDEAA